MITVTLTEAEILATPNAYALGEIVQERYWNQKNRENEFVRSLKMSQPELPFPEYDLCVVCGQESPYTQGHDVDFRVGYVEGGGQGCFQPVECFQPSECKK